MPRSSRGSTSHRGHRTRGRHTERPQASQAAVAIPQDVAAVDADEEVADSAESTQVREPAHRVATPAPQSAATTVSGTTMRGDPLLTKELIRIAVLAAVVLALLITFTTLLR